MTTEKTLTRVPELDGIRGLAALAVFANHFLDLWDRDKGADFGPIFRAIYGARGYGAFGVDVFFVLSGFLITSLLLADRRSQTYFHDFYWKRALRILPVYLIHLLATALYFPHWHGYVLLSLLFLVNFAGLFHVQAPGPAWTLAIEEQFYLLWPQAIRRLQPKTLYGLAFALVLTSNLLRIVVPLVHGGANSKFTFYRCDGLALGALIAFERFLPLEGSRTIQKAMAVLKSNWTLIGVVALAIAVNLHNHGSVMTRQTSLTAMNLLFYRIIRYVIFHRGRTLRWLATPAAVYLGSISYALYMYQGYVIFPMERWLGHVPPSSWGAIVLRLFVDLTACLAVCTISRFAIELPAQRLRRFVIRPRRLTPVPVQTAVRPTPSI
jgi:peptidoglycan/LPS O-acetylase OafA/YrhL